MNEKQIKLFLKALAKILWDSKAEIISANKKDLFLAEEKQLAVSLKERLVLNEAGIKAIILRLKGIEKLKSGVGKVVEKRELSNGLTLKKIKTAIGKILVIYEARPEVTIDASILCLKSSNRVILKGGSEALETNKILFNCIQKALAQAGIERDWVEFISSRDEALNLIKNPQVLDLVIARGGYDLVSAILKESQVPVLSHSAGGARIYVDESADLNMALDICLNAKLSKPSACNSLDTVILHKKIASQFLNSLNADKNIKLVYSEYESEFLSNKLAVKVVDNLTQALEFIQKYSRNHSEGVIAQNKKVIEEFINKIDAASLFINCSTRLHDGYIFGMGAEMGISTGKLHARGPVGLQELTSYKWVMEGQGNIR